jgi:Uma2 family endonuclease
MVQILSKSLSLENFLQLPDTQPASEFINNEIIQKSMPKGSHSVIQGELVTAINAVVKPQKLARAFPELRCSFDGRAIVPDVSVFKSDRIPMYQDGRIAEEFEIAPDWMIEILSPDQSQTKVIKKILHSLEHGTEMGWLIDPNEQTIFVFTPDQRSQVLDKPDEILPVPNFAIGLNLTIRNLFDWLIC